ncbi:MAG: glycosyltransferase family 2 protein [Candidatus Micrarchaeia archaeon]
MHKLSIIVPTKNEENGPKIVRELMEAFGDGTEIIVVDKSNDEYYEALAKTKATVIRQRSQGYENAIMEGFAIASGDILASLDADGTYSVEDLKKVVNALESDERYDFVSGSRFGNMSKDAMEWHLKFGNIMLAKIFNLLYKQNMHDVLSGSFAMTRRAYEKIKNIEAYRAGTIFFEIEIIRKGYKIKDIPISYRARAGTKSKITKAKPVYGLVMAYHAIRYARDYNPLVIFGGIGLVLVVAGLALGIYVIMNFIASGVFNEIGRALIAFMLVVLGFLSIVTGFLLDLMLEIDKKIYEK